MCTESVAVRRGTSPCQDRRRSPLCRTTLVSRRHPRALWCPVQRSGCPDLPHRRPMQRAGALGFIPMRRTMLSAGGAPPGSARSRDATRHRAATPVVLRSAPTIGLPRGPRAAAMAAPPAPTLPRRACGARPRRPPSRAPGPSPARPGARRRFPARGHGDDRTTRGRCPPPGPRENRGVTGRRSMASQRGDGTACPYCPTCPRSRA